jgi:hypothetical protein
MDTSDYSKMKHSINIFLILLLFLFTSHSYGRYRSDNYFHNNKFEQFKHEINGVEISIDPRIEFFQILNLVGGNPAINTTEMDYKLDIIRYFDKYKNHSAFNYLRNNYSKFFTSIDAPYSLLLSLNNDFTFREDLVDNNWINKPDIENLLDVMRTFLIESDFVKFFNSQAEFYELVLTNTIYTLSDFDEKNRIIHYFGNENADDHHFVLILNFLGFGNFGKGIRTVKGEDHFAIVSPGSGNGVLPVFEKNQMLALIWHEFCHSFSNPLVDKYWKDFDSLFHLYEPISESMKGQAYDNWHSVVYEHLVRAVTCRLGAIKYSEDFAQVNLNRIEIGQKFIYTIPIIESLKEYERSRDRYPALDGYIPTILNTLKNVSKDSIDSWLKRTEQIREPDIEDIPSNGEIYDRENRLLILSTCEEDTSANRRLREYIMKTHHDYKFVADTIALNMDLKDYNLFAIGTPWGNKFIETYMRLLPIKITKERLIANQEYEGKGYAIFTGWINPFNQENVMTIYASQNPANLINFGMVPRGSTDYQIVKDLITLKAADYKRYKKMWICY